MGVSALAMTGGLADHFEAPGAGLIFLGCVSNADALVGNDLTLEAVVDDIEFFVADALTVQFSGDA